MNQINFTPTKTPVKGKCPFNHGAGAKTTAKTSGTETATPVENISLSGEKSECPSAHTLAGVSLDSAASAALGTLPGVSKAGCPKCS